MVTASLARTRGGAEAQCQLLSARLAEAGVSVTVLTRGADDREAATQLPFAVRRFATGKTGRLGGLGFALAGACWLAARGGRFGILHAHQALSPALTAVLAKRLRPTYRVVVKVACSGAWSDFRLAQEGAFYRQRVALLRAVDQFVVLNGESAKEVGLAGLAGVPIRHIPNGVDVACFAPPTNDERASLRTRFGFSNDATTALYVGRLERRKGLDVLLKAWGELVRRRVALQLVLVGAGDIAPWSREAARLGVGNRVRFLGERQDVADLYRAADLFVFPSRAEGCPNAVLEAMSCGLPIVATDIAGNRTVLGDDNDVGRLVSPETPEGFAEAVADLAQSSALRRDMGAAARAAVLRRFDMRLVVAQYLSLYEELMGPTWLRRKDDGTV